MKLTQIFREITAAQAAANRARADAQYDAMQKSESKYKELAQAVQNATGLPTKSLYDTIYFPKKEIYWGMGNGPALKEKITQILKQYVGEDAKFLFDDYEEGEPDERAPLDAKISIMK